MKKTLRFLTVLCTMLCSTAVWAQNGQYAGTSEQKCKADYSTENIEFDLAEMASFFGVSTETFAADLNAFIEADKTEYKVDDNSDKNLYFLQVVNGGEQTFPNADQGYSANLGEYMCGFWMNVDAVPQGYGEGAMWYWLVQVSEDASKVEFRLGQMPDAWKAGGESTADIRLAYNGKMANIALTLKVAPEEVVEGIETTLSKVVVVGKKDITFNQQLNTGADSIKVVVDDMAEKLGLDKAVLAESFKKRIYTQVYRFDADGENMIGWVDSLTHERTAGDEGGFWFGQTWKEEDVKSTTCARVSWGSNANFFVEQLAWDPDTYEFLAVAGQYNGSNQENTDYDATIFVMNGAKAYELHYMLHVDEYKGLTFEDMTEAGHQDIYVEAEVAKTGYPTIPVTVDLDAIATALGIDVSAIEYKAESADKELYTGAPTEGSGLWYYTRDCYVGTWGAGDPFFLAYANGSSDKANLILGQYGGKLEAEAGEEFTFKLYVLGTAQYYVVNIHLKIIKQEQSARDNWKVVAHDTYDVMLVPKSDYELDQKTTIDMEHVMRVLEAEKLANIALFCRTTSESTSPDSIYTNDYTCTPHPGFWMDNSGEHNGAWGSGAAYGMTLKYDTGVITWYNMPNERFVGDTYTTHFYLINVVNGKIYDMTMNISFVDASDLIEIEEVGSEDVSIILSELTRDANFFYTKELDLTAACTALGIDVSEWESAQWYLATSDGTLRVKPAGDFAGEGAYFDKDGMRTSSADYETDKTVFTLGYEDGKLQVGFPNYGIIAGTTGDAYNDYPADLCAKTRIGISMEHKVYGFNLTIAATPEIVGITGVESNASKYVEVYDLSGRVVRADGLARGIYIKNGQKVLVK